MDKHQLKDCKLIQEAFKIYGGIDITISKAHWLWKNFSEGYCGSWEDGCQDYKDNLGDLYDILNNIWISRTPFSLGNIMRLTRKINLK